MQIIRGAVIAKLLLQFYNATISEMCFVKNQNIFNRRILWLFPKKMKKPPRDQRLEKNCFEWNFWSNLCLNCIFQWTWLVKKSIWPVIDRSRVRFPVPAALIFSFSSHFSHFFDSVPLLFHSNFQSWQMRSLPTLDPYVFYRNDYSKVTQPLITTAIACARALTHLRLSKILLRIILMGVAGKTFFDAFSVLLYFSFELAAEVCRASVCKKNCVFQILQHHVNVWSKRSVK